MSGSSSSSSSSSGMAQEGAGGSSSSSSSASSSSSGGTGGTIVDGCPDPTEDITEIPVGSLSMGIAKAFPICGRTLGFTALVTSPDPNDVIGVARLRNPDIKSVIDNFAMAGHTTAVFGDYGWVGAANPQSDTPEALPVQEGNWRITLGDDDGSLMSGDVTVFARRTMDGAFHGGVVDVNIFLLQGAATENYVKSVVNKMFPYAGLELGTVKVYPLAAQYATVSSSQELNALLASSKGIGTTPALNLFVIGSFGAGFGDAIGVAGGIPGSPMRQGTGMSGVAYLPSNMSGYDASVLRHETGHLAGLFHTTEYAIQETDPLSDTVTCSFATMQNNPQQCPDVDNAMFPIAFGAVDFTAAQERMIHGSMLYRGILQAGGAPSPPKPVPPVPGAPKLLPLPSEANSVGFVDQSPRISAGSIERLLLGSPCLKGGGHEHAGDYLDLVIRAAGDEAVSVFRSLVLDEGAPDLIRSRALRAYLRSSGNRVNRVNRVKEQERALALIQALASNRSLSGRLRVTALTLLAEHKGTQGLAQPLLIGLSGESEPNPLVRLVAADLNKKLFP